MPAGYIIGLVDIHDPVAYEAYKTLSSAAMQQHGAQVCVRGGRFEVLEGDWQPQRVVMLKFPSYEAAQAFHASAEYSRARAVREAVSTMRLICVEGV